MHTTLRPTGVALASIALAAVAVAGCSAGSDAGKATTTVASTRPEGSTSSSTVAGGSGPLTILVTNDVGYGSHGIDVLVQALDALPDTDVVVVAPLTNQSGSGGKTTAGQVKTSKVRTRSGHPATAVAGYPADAVRVALDQLGVRPDLVVSGINQGQNLGPVIDASGTVGAARAGAAAGHPALAVSQGAGEAPAYGTALPYVLDWVRANRAGAVAGTAPAQVTNLNVPTCGSGRLQGLRRVPLAAGGEVSQSDVACTGARHVADDVSGFNLGYATETLIPLRPAR